MALTVSKMTGGSNAHETTSEEANGLATDFVSEGIIGSYSNTGGVAPATGAFAVNAQGTPDMTVAVSSGVAYVTGTPTSQNSQTFRVYNSASENVTISANSSGSTKYDWVYIKLDATLLANPTLAGTTTATLVTSRSTSAGTDDGTPPTYGYPVAVVTVANGAVSITNSTIRDIRATASIGTAAGIATGWNETGLPAVSSVTNNGNRSYSVVFASTVASLLSPGMRLRTTRTVTAPTYMGGLFNGSSHYFVKTTPTSTLSTVANNFTVMAWVELTSYAICSIAARADAAVNNSLELGINASGQVRVTVINGGAANVRYIDSQQSLPLNKKTHVAASWTGGTVVIYFDGVSVPVTTAATGGTAPTTAGTGGDFAVGRRGASSTYYFPGYISGLGVFDAVLTASTIKSYSSQVLAGSETNCIGAWSLNNTGVNQQAAGTNDLTATGGVSYTVRSPYSTNGAGTNDGIYDYALVMKVSTTTATVQVPEGCTIPTSGGVSATAYSTTANPFGWVVDKGRWEVESMFNTLMTQNAITATTWTNISSISFSCPLGCTPGYEGSVQFNPTAAGNIEYEVTLSTSNNTESDLRMTNGLNCGVATQVSLGGYVQKTALSPTSAATTYYFNMYTLVGGIGYARGDKGQFLLKAIPAGV